MPDKPDAPTNPDTTDSPVVDDVSKALVLKFNANGGTLDDDGAITKDIILKTDSSGNVTVTLSQTAEREGYTFTGWNTSPDGSGGTSYPNGSVINQNDFNGSEPLTLYAQWENSNPTTNPDNPESIPTQEESYNPEDDTDPIDTPTPTNEETQEEISVIDEGISIYGAMKGNYTGTTNTKGLEEMTTYNTWWATYNKLGTNFIYSPNDKNSDGTAQGQGTRYDPSKPYREEKLYIDSTTKQDKSFIFFDLGSDIMYVDHHEGNTTVKNKSGTIMPRHNWGGLLKYSWDSTDVQNSAVVFNSLYAHANSYGSYNCLDGTNKPGTYTYTGNYYEFKYNFYNTSGKEVDYSSGEKGIRYRIHTTIDIKNIWPVRQNKSALNSSYASRVVSDADPLYIRIEGEELNEADHDRQNTTARQMFINVKAGNTGSNARPLVIFYEGPDRGLTEGFDDADITENQSKSPKENYPYLTRRPSQPVVLNLQADFKGILFAPSSPVVILGNGHKMLGFVIAKEFVQLDTSSGTSITRDGITFCVDSWGNLKTKALPATSRRRPTYAETPTGQTYDEYLTTYYSTFIDFKKKYFVNYEYVYLRSAFNLSLDSYYDSFKIPELERKIYLYLEKYKINAPSVDMFFTTVRSKWIT